METLKKILADEDEVDLTPMIDVTFFAPYLFHGYDNAQATGGGVIYSIARKAPK